MEADKIPAGASKEKTTVAVLKEQLALIGILVVLIGTIYTDSYYAAFGLRYQSLSLPASHVLYRGFTVLIGAPYVAIPYLLAVVWLALMSIKSESTWIGRNQVWLTYLILTTILGLTYPLTVHAGLSAAAQDRGMGSRLPKIKRMMSSHADAPACQPDQCRLLLTDTDYIYVFAPQANQNDLPNLKRLDRKEFNEIDTGTQ